MRSSRNSNYRVEVTIPAQRDAWEYAHFIARNGSPEAASRWLKALYDKMAALRRMPKKFPPIPEESEIGVGCRQFSHHSHRVVYRVDELAKTVFVLRVYHHARQPLRRDDLD